MSSRLVVAAETAQPTVLSFITRKQKHKSFPLFKRKFSQRKYVQHIPRKVKFILTTNLSNYVYFNRTEM